RRFACAYRNRGSRHRNPAHRRLSRREGEGKEMRLLTILMTVVVFSKTGLMAQDQPAEPKHPTLEAVVIPVKTLSGDSFRRLEKMLSVFGVRYVADDKLRTILVYASPEVVAQMRRVIEQLDRPGSEAAIGHN